MSLRVTRYRCSIPPLQSAACPCKPRYAIRSPPKSSEGSGSSIRIFRVRPVVFRDSSVASDESSASRSVRITDRASSAAAAHVLGGGAFVRWDEDEPSVDADTDADDSDAARVRVVFEEDDDEVDVVKANAFTRRRRRVVVVVGFAALAIRRASRRRDPQQNSRLGCVVDIARVVVVVVCRLLPTGRLVGHPRYV